MILHTSFSQQEKERIGIYLTLSALCVVFFGFFHFFYPTFIPVPWDVERRITSFFPYPNAVGLFLAPITSGLFSYSILEKHITKKMRIALTLCAALMLITIYFAKTEAALVAIPAALLLTLCASPLSQKKKAFILGIAILLGALGLSFEPIREKLFLRDASGLVRQSQWHETLLLLLDYQQN